MIRFSALLLAAGLAAAGCATPGTDLTPAPSATTVTAERAVDRVRGVRVTAEPNAWTGLARVATQVTPMRVSIQNNGSVPVRLRYSDFVLVTDAGARYSALPPYQIGGEVTEPTLVDAGVPVNRPGFTYDRFTVAQPYAGLYPSIRAYTRPYTYDRTYYDRYATVYRDVALPTDEMLAQVLPEGVVEPGGNVRGFLYFEHVPDDAGRVRFRADVVNADTGEAFGEVSIPFVVGS